MTTYIASEPATNIAERIEREFAPSFIQTRETRESDVVDEQQVLAARALTGGEDAFEAILERYKGLMLRTAYSIVKDQDIAEDAVQNALIQAWMHLPSLRETGALRSWLMRIVVNQCISFKRRFARTALFLQQAYAEQETERASQVANDAEGVMEGTWDLARAIEELPARQQTVINLHYYQGMMLPEMSQTLQTSENTLKKRIQAALSNLRRMLRQAETDAFTSSSGLQSPVGS